MAPASGRRRTRREAEPAQIDPGEPVVETPTRKRRKVNGDTKDAVTPSSRRSTRDVQATATGSPTRNTGVKRQTSADTEETIENSNDTEAEEIALYNLAEDIIRNLRVAQYEIMAQKDYHNSIVDKTAQAFAKIAGREWTYYVSKLKVIFGRPNAKKTGTSASPSSATTPRPLADMAIDIDLGPDQQVSRLHAEIAFDQEQQKWFIFANGRNGIFLDNQKVEAGHRAWLRSGCVIGIIGTQMIFLLPGTPPLIHPDIRRQLLPEYDEDDENDAKHDPNHMPGPGRSRGRGTFHTTTAAQVYGNPIGGNQYSTTAPDSSQNLPGTPVSKLKEAVVPKPKPSPTYGRGVMMESTEDIDYSLDSAKDIKPPHSYAAMIGQAILSTPEENATLARIYEFIKEKYAYFRFNGGGWQNSIRHNLSLSKCFEKIPRRTDEPGKGMKWQIVPDFRDEFMKKNIQSARRKTTGGSSMPTSPAAAQLPGSGGATAQTERLMGVIGERSTTPPLIGLSTRGDSYTPDRLAQSGFLNAGELPRGHDATPSTIGTKSQRVTPVFDRTGGVRFAAPEQSAQEARQAAMNLTSPPTMHNSSSTGYDALLTAPPGSSNLFTPLPPRQRLHLSGPLGAPGLQSTTKVPSFYAKELLSSPAPFWKYVDIGSGNTGLARLPEESPSKVDEDEDDEEEEEEDEDGLPVESSPVKRGNKFVATSSPPGLVRTSEPAEEHMDMSRDKDETASPAGTVTRPNSRHQPDVAEGDETIVISTNENGPAALEIKIEGGIELAANGGAANGNENGAPITPIKRSSTQSPTKSFQQQQHPVGALPASKPTNPFSRVQPQVDDDEEDEIDLARGFEKIGNFHRSMHMMQQGSGTPGVNGNGGIHHQAGHQHQHPPPPQGMMGMGMH